MIGFSGNYIWQLIIQSDLMTKIVLLILFGMLTTCLAVFLLKIIFLSIKRRQMQEALRQLKNVSTFDELRITITALGKTLPGYFLKKNLSYLKSLLEMHPDRLELSEIELSFFQHHMEQTLEDIIHNEESYLPILFSCASVSPLLGLFGTIWGLVHAFVRISEKQTADIVTIAPGIAEALITTLAGLVVAIPALLMYHYLHTQTRKLEFQLYTISDKFNWFVQKLFIK